MRFSTKMTTQRWMTFLMTLQETSNTFEPPLILCWKLTMFSNTNSKRLWVQKAQEEAVADLEDGRLTQAQSAASVESWALGLTIGGFLPLLQNTGILAIFTNALGNAVQQQAEKPVAWHTYAIHFQHGILAIYDPNFVPGTQRLSACQGIPLAKELVKALKGKRSNRRLHEVWVGGGGNRRVSCQEMTRRWVEDEIIIKRGADLGAWERQAGWTKVHF